ncbi:MAG: CvpA family protein [Schleiferiaceae bacterium]|nr:CvpA family protein [Schleiferiaceae bacterium]
MVGLDLVIVVFCAFLVAKGIWKGFVKEIAGIVAVIGGVAVSFLFHSQVQPYMAAFVGERYVQLVSYVIVFLGFYLVVMLLGKLLDKILRSIMLGGVNRVLGALFGLIKACFWLTLLTFAYTKLHLGIGFNHPVWVTDSICYPFLLDLVSVGESLIPN